MLGLAEYKAVSAELLTLGEKYEELIREGLNEGMSKQAAVTWARKFVSPYQSEYKELLKSGLMEIAENAVSYYSDTLGVDLPETLAADMVKKQYETKYYGATLADRLKVNERQLIRRIVRTGAANSLLLDRVFTKPIPFGAQTHVDNRILLATAAKIENDIAKRVAGHAEADLIRWTLSHRHTVTDQCDVYANTVNDEVADFMVTNGIDADATGVFFREQLPDPPHPNCQCEYHVITDQTVSHHNAVRRTFEKIRNILRRLRRK